MHWEMAVKLSVQTFESKDGDWCDGDFLRSTRKTSKNNHDPYGDNRQFPIVAGEPLLLAFSYQRVERVLPGEAHLAKNMPLHSGPNFRPAKASS